MQDKIADIDIVLAVLGSGHSVELPAKGYSMFPAFKPGSRILVGPFDAGKAIPGCVVVSKTDNDLVMHRLIEIITDNSGSTKYITQGDSRLERDLPRPTESIIGVAISYQADGNTYMVKPFLPGKIRHLFNYYLLWLSFKFKKFFGIFNTY